MEDLKEELMSIKTLGGFKVDFLLLTRDKIINQYLIDQKATHFLTSENSE